MLRRMSFTLATLLLAGGCMKPSMDMGPPKKPAPAPEMKKLERMIGNWSSTAEMSPCPTDKQEPMKGGGKMEWVLGGTAMKAEGWHEMGNGEKGNYIEYWWWDAKANKFASWFRDDFGMTGWGWITPCADCDGFCVKAHGLDADGHRIRWAGCMKFVDNDNQEWSFTMKGPMGKMSMKGTSKRQK